ncbi:hypothetical protein TrLO_g14201 [Triparma laevis f. longispina]|uniref:Uncharacterized protein n=1 Tax=Triparma laevis f. longispina TaxID=1714387 RepID=A0A9W7C6E7_9STRA|nr:hypothetical protein TrLO_g14201 [Triparma laevis f. longispina]
MLAVSASSTGENNTAVLAAFKALQDRIRTLDHDRAEAASRAAQLRSELANREQDSVSQREDFANEEIDKLEMSRRDYDRLLTSKHQCEIDLARNEERRKAASSSTNLEKNRGEDYRAEKAACEGKVALLRQRNAGLEREIDGGKENLKRLQNVVAEVESDGESRISALSKQLQHVKASISDEDVLAHEMDAKLVRQEEFLKSVMSINEALVQSAHQSRESGLTPRSHHTSDSSSSSMRRRMAMEGKKKKKKKKKKIVKKAKPTTQYPPPTHSQPRAHHPPPPPRRRRPSPAPLPPPRRRGENYVSEGPEIRTTKSSRLAAAAAQSRIDEMEGTLTLKERMRNANFGPVPFLPAPQKHSFNVLAVCSEAVRTEVGDLEYKVTHHKGSVSIVPSPPRNSTHTPLQPRHTVGQAILKRGGGETTLEVSMPTLSINLSTTPGRETKTIAQTTPPQSKAQTANSSTPPFMTPNATTPVKTPKSKRQQQQQLPPNLVELISSLEEEFEEMNDKYVSLLSRANTDTGSVRMAKKEDEVELKKVADAMEKKEQQMRMIRSAVIKSAITTPSEK